MKSGRDRNFVRDRVATMPKMRRGQIRDNDGTAWLAALMLLALVVLFALAWQAYDAVRSHREVADGVLRDYAGLAADELVRRSLQAVGYSAAVPLLQQVTLLGERAQEGVLASPDLMAEVGDPRLRDAAPIMAATVRLEIASGELETAGDPLAASSIAWLTDTLADPDVHLRHGRSLVDSRYSVAGDDEIRLIFSPVSETSERVYGFVLDTGALGPRLSGTLLQTAVLPASLGADAPDSDALGNDRLAIRITDAADRTVLEHGTPPGPYDPGWIAREFGDSYGGLLDGWRLRVAIDPQAASRLVIGGLPRSRLPAVAGLIALGLALFAGALVQLRRARRLARLRADFVAEVSHELRTPLTQIRMFNEMLLLGRVRSEDDARRAHEIVDREARRLGRLVDNVLAFARRERDERPLNFEVRPLTPIVTAVVEEMEPLAAARDATIEMDLDDALWARVDPEAVHQMLLNLLDNAIKYGPAGQSIRATLEATPGNRVEIAITDRGPGVPRRDRERIFDSYHRLDRDRKAAVAGAGIGLSVVRQLAAHHKGGARVEAADGGGARFVIDLPRAAPREEG